MWKHIWTQGRAEKAESERFCWEVKGRNCWGGSENWSTEPKSNWEWWKDYKGPQVIKKRLEREVSRRSPYEHLASAATLCGRLGLRKQWRQSQHAVAAQSRRWCTFWSLAVLNSPRVNQNNFPFPLNASLELFVTPPLHFKIPSWNDLQLELKLSSLVKTFSFSLYKRTLIISVMGSGRCSTQVPWDPSALSDHPSSGVQNQSVHGNTFPWGPWVLAQLGNRSREPVCLPAPSQASDRHGM